MRQSVVFPDWRGPVIVKIGKCLAASWTRACKVRLIMAALPDGAICQYDSQMAPTGRAGAVAIGRNGETCIAGVVYDQVHFDDMTIPGAGQRTFITSVVPDIAAAPSGPDLGAAPILACNPNPFQTRARITLTTTGSGIVRLAIHDATGALVRTLVVDRRAGAGRGRSGAAG